MENQFNILVVDDEIINLENIRHYLSKQGYSIQIAENGYVAMERIDTNHFDLVVTDLKMEGVNGTQVMAYSKEILPDAEVIITAYGVTSRTSKKIVDLARESGIKMGLHRPITLWPFPVDRISELADRDNVKAFISIEMSVGQMVEDVRLAVNGKKPTYFYGRTGGIIPTPEEVLADYSDHFIPTAADLEEELTSLTAGCWNIWHGGKHYTVDENGWDSRETIAEILRRENADVVMMQETYSSGDFIAAELGYYFATTVDWDYLNQGSNISVLSRYPIKDLYVQNGSPFMNVGVKVAISKTQDMYVMSNWYGIQQFPAVFEFHESRFSESDVVPTLFAGDFNAVPHTDGGDSPASLTMLNAGFTDAFRSLYPDLDAFPGHTHRGGVRIDQLYHKGAGLLNTSTRIVSTWPTGFPSDHYLILSTFDLDYSTPGVSR